MIQFSPDVPIVLSGGISIISIVTVAYFAGQYSNRIESVEKALAELAPKDSLTTLQTSLNEVKFTLNKSHEDLKESLDGLRISNENLRNSITELSANQRNLEQRFSGASRERIPSGSVAQTS